MDRKNLYLTAAGIGAGLLVRSALHRRVSEGFYGKSVLITGGARGLGLALAREFAAEGARLALCDNDPVELDLACRELQTRYARVFPVRCDVTNPAQVDGMAGTVIERYGTIDVLVNNAYPAEPPRGHEIAIEDLEQAMEALFWSVVHPTRAVLPHMLERKAGRIVTLTYDGGKLASAKFLPRDCATLAAIGFSEALRSEMRPENIAVVTIAAGRLSSQEARAARQIVTATDRGEANGLSAGDHSGILRLVGAALDGENQPQRMPVMSVLATMGRLAARRYL
jgi:NAD(P)-dependent dehydrogenase (short-subunit alcohol dehydrogenase family)